MTWLRYVCKVNVKYFYYFYRDLCGFQSFFNFAIVVAALAHTNRQHASIKKMIASGRVDS